MKTIWTEEEPEYHGEFVNFDKMKQWPKPLPEAASADHRRRRLPLCRAARHPLRRRLDPARRLAGEGRRRRVIDKFRTMATEAGRDPASLPITIFRVPDDLERLRFCQEIGIDRVVFSLPAEKEDKILPILDRWAELKRQLNGG